MSLYYIDIEEIKEKIAQRDLRRKKIKYKQLLDFLPFKEIKYNNVHEELNKFGEKLYRIDGEIPVDLDVVNGQRFLFISYDQTALTHGLHKYPAKFFPELPRWLIKRYSKEYDIVLDPFTGSGTTNVEALLNKRHSVGIDVDPFSRYLSKVKTTPLNIDELLWAQENLIEKIIEYSPSKVAFEDIPDFPYRDNWFNKEIILELAFIKKNIEKLPVSNNTKDFFKINFSSIIRNVSNADDHCTRTVIRKKLNKNVTPSDALKKFIETILLNVPKMVEFSKICPSGINVEFPDNSDARDIKYDSGYFDLAITSPPYANAVDYPRTHQLEMYWLGFANGTLIPLKKKHVGTESVEAKDYKDLHLIGISEADNVIKKIYENDKRRAFIVYKYLYDMKKNIEEVYRVLRNGGRYIIVVGNNKIRGNLFENWKYLMELAVQVGFDVEKYFASEIIRHFIKIPREERINTDWIIVLKK